MACGRHQQQLGTSSSCWSLTTVGWHSFPQLAFVASQPMWISWSLWNKQKAQADPAEVFNGVEVRTAGRPLHCLHSYILEVVSDKTHSVGVSVVILEDRIWSQTVEIWDRRWLQNVILISLCIESASTDDERCFSSEGDAAPHHHTASTKWCLLCAAITTLCAFSTLSVYDPGAVGRIWTHRWM